MELVVASEGKGVLEKLKVKKYLYLKGGIVVLLGEVFPQGSLSYLLGCERPGDGLGLEEPCLTAGHHLTRLHGHVKELLETLKFILRIVSFLRIKKSLLLKATIMSRRTLERDGYGLELYRCVG